MEETEVKTTTRKSTRKPKTVDAEQQVSEPVVKEKPIVAKDVDIDQYVTVKNGFQGKLIYRSKRTGEVYEWDSFGDEQELELKELKQAKNSYKKFFINNWFMFDEDWIIDYLGLKQYYKHAIRLEDFDKIFTQKPAAIKKTISDMSKGQQKSLAYRASELIRDHKIDSLSVIDALEESLGMQLIEK